MSFKFNFSTSADDSDSDSEAPAPTTTTTTTTAAAPTNDVLPATPHTLTTLLTTLPRNLSFTLTPTTPPLPRRELYDVKMQLMAEDTLSSSATSLLAINSAEDIRTRVYEGGLKSWECSLDLAGYLVDAPAPRRVLELGCGTALPSLQVFRSILEGGKEGCELWLADYNVDVLRLVTVPNLFLVWVAAIRGLEVDEAGRGDVDASPELRCEFLADLEARGVALRFVSGAWGAGMVDILLGEGEGKFDLVLGSETIYSPATTADFTHVLLESVKPDGGRGLVAAKRIYFGVGGSVEDFVAGVDRRGEGWVTRTVKDLVDVGVGRVIVEVSRNAA